MLTTEDKDVPTGCAEPSLRCAPEWTVSIVAHGHERSVLGLLQSLAQHEGIADIEVVLTLNRGPVDPLIEYGARWPGRLLIVNNANPKGFGANHNAALHRATGRYFSTLDPDIRLSSSIFQAQSRFLALHPSALCAAPYQDSQGCLQDNARPVPTPVGLLRRILAGRRTQASTPGPAHDWLAGLQIAGRTERLRLLGGFDDRYFMYCEDVHLGIKNILAGGANVLLDIAPQHHDASRASHHNLLHLGWHLKSLVKLWSSSDFRKYLSCRRT